jgi:hypothetical protein
MTRHSHELMTEELQINIVNTSKSWKTTLLFHRILGTSSEMYNKGKIDIQKLHQMLVPTHPRSRILKTRARSYGKNIGGRTF